MALLDDAAVGRLTLPQRELLAALMNRFGPHGGAPLATSSSLTEYPTGHIERAVRLGIRSGRLSSEGLRVAQFLLDFVAAEREAQRQKV